MKKAFGILLILVGLGSIIYVGGWLCFIGGIVQVVEAIKATPVKSMGIAMGLLRITLFTSLSITASIFFIIVPGLFLCGLNNNSNHETGVSEWEKKKYYYK